MKTAADLGCIAAAFTLGNIYHYNQNAERMDEYYWKIAENYSGACNNLAFLFFNRGDLPQALFYFRKAIELKPTCADYHLNLAKILGATDEANARYLSAISLIHDLKQKADIYFILGNNTYRQGRVVTAYYELCVALKPEHYQARLMAAFTGTDPAVCHAHADAVLAAMPDNVGALCLKGRLYMRQKNRAAAEPLFRRALKIVPPGKAAEEIEANLRPFGPLTRKRARFCESS
jgi:tetratricopeptide (TPR) repeat protein